MSTSRGDDAATDPTDRHPIGASMGTRGVWLGTDGMDARLVTELAHEIETLGYGAWWIPEAMGREVFVLASHLVDATDALVVATGVANIFNRHPGAMVQARETLAEQSGGRFLLGLGVSHERVVAGIRKLDYSRPLGAMREYLDAMATAPYLGPAAPAYQPTVLAALGPRMLELAAAATDGAHTYSATVDHTAAARAVLGPGRLLCVEQKVILCTDAAEARSTARRALAPYFGMPNYARNWLRHGLEPDDLDDGGSDRLVDALVAWGSTDDIERRLDEHLDAGATHVCIQPITPGVDRPGLMSLPDRDALRALAPRPA